MDFDSPITSNNSNNSNNSKFFIYARKSIHTQKGESIKNQVEICKKYIYDHFPNTIGDSINVYTDDGYSGKNTNRPRYEAMMEDINKEKNGYLVCYKLDRVSRSISDFSALINNLSDKKVGFVSVKEQFDTSTICGRTIMYIFAVFAQIERENTTELVRDNMLMLARKGHWLGGKPPFGFTIKKDFEIMPNGMKKRFSTLETNEKIEIVKAMYAKYLELGSIRGVRNDIFDSGFRDDNGYMFRPKFIKRILSNPFYCTADANAFKYFSERCNNVFLEGKHLSKKQGISVYNRLSGHKCTPNPISDWIIALGSHEGVIPGKDWVKIQNIFSTIRSNPTSRWRKSETLLSGLVVCKNCNAKMRSAGYRNHSNYYYVCNMKQEYGAKQFPCKNIRCSEVDNFVLDYLRKLEPKVLRQKIHMKSITHKENKLDDEIFSLKDTIAELRKSKTKLMAHLENLPLGSVLIKEIENNAKQINKKIHDAKLKVEDLTIQKHENSNKRKNLDHIVDALKELQRDFSKLTFDKKKSLVRLIVNKVVWTNDNWDIVFNNQ